MGYKETRNEVALFIHSLVWRASIVCFVFKVDAEIIGCGTLTLLAIVSITILLSYLIEGREVVQSTVIDATFSFLAATLLMTAGGMACHTYNQVFALSGPPVIANLNISRNSQQG